jgi:uncharacterized damage-inducible protein DinB
VGDVGPLVEEAIEALGFARQGTIAEAANIPEDRWDYKPHPSSKSVSELVRHMLDATAMLVGEATDPDGDFRRRSPEEHVQAHGGSPEAGTPAELKQALAESHDALVQRIQAAGEDLLARPIRRFDGGTWSRLTYVFYAASHEDYHRGQLALYARGMGLVPALTKRIHGDRAE